jgi:hypothetical protein
MNERQASPHTIGSYRDAFRLLLQFTQRRLNKPPSHLTFEEIDAPLVTASLEDLEKSPGITTISQFATGHVAFARHPRARPLGLDISRSPMRSLSLRPDDSLTIPKMALSIDFIRFVSSTNAIPGFWTPTLVGYLLLNTSAFLPPDIWVTCCPSSLRQSRISANMPPSAVSASDGRRTVSHYRILEMLGGGGRGEMRTAAVATGPYSSTVTHTGTCHG